MESKPKLVVHQITEGFFKGTSIDYWLCKCCKCGKRSIISAHVLKAPREEPTVACSECFEFSKNAEANSPEQYKEIKSWIDTKEETNGG